MEQKKYIKAILWLGSTILVVIAINILLSLTHPRIDLTEDKIYTLSDGSKKIIRKLDSEVIVKFFFSRSLKELPPVLKTYAARVEEILDSYAKISNGNIKLEIYDPKPDSDEEELAKQYGIQATPLPTGDNFYFGLVMIKGKKQSLIPYLDPRREEFLEYDLSEAIYRLQKDEKEKIGVLSALPIIGQEGIPGYGQSQPSWVVIDQLKRMYDVVKIDPSAKTIDQDLSALMIVHPKQLSEELEFSIEQYLLKGGHVFIAVTPFSRYDFAISRQQNPIQNGPVNASSDLSHLFPAWGIQYDSKRIVGDLGRMIEITTQSGRVNYPFFLNLQEDSFAKDFIATQQLKHMMYTEGGFFNMDAAAKNNFEEVKELIHIGGNGTGDASTFMAGVLPPQSMTQEFKRTEKDYVLALYLRGKIKPAFTKAPEGIKDVKIITEAQKPASIILISDVDFMADQNSVQVFRFGPQVLVRPRNDNLNFVLNSLEFLTGSEDLISIRNSGRISRPFTKVQELQKQAQIKYKAEEERLSKKLEELQKKLRELEGEKTESGRFFLSAQQQEEIHKFRQEEARLKKERRKVRKNLREDIERLGRIVIVANMLGVPLAVLIWGVLVFIRRTQRYRKGGSRS